VCVCVISYAIELVLAYLSRDPKTVMFLLCTLFGVSRLNVLVQQRLVRRPTCVRAYIAASEACSDAG
jgi:hypothetical protein